MAQVISLKNKLAIAKVKNDCASYKEKVQAMSKLELLEEMVRFNEEWQLVDIPALEMIVKGMIFFEIIKATCETQELLNTVDFYYSLLQEELKAYEQQSG